MKIYVQLWYNLAEFIVEREREREMFQTKEKIRTHITSLISPPPPKKNCVGYEVMWKNVVELDKQWMAVQCVRCACWMSKVINTHSKYRIFTAILQLQWLHKRASLLCYMYIAWLV